MNSSVKISPTPYRLIPTHPSLKLLAEKFAGFSLLGAVPPLD